MDTDSIYAKLNMTHEKYIEILEKNKDLFGKDIGQIEPECLDNPIQESVFIFKSYGYICKKDIPNNKHKMKNNILHTKGISNSYSQKYIDHNLAGKWKYIKILSIKGSIKLIFFRKGIKYVYNRLAFD